MNANSDSQDQIRYIEKNYFPILKKIRVDGVILSDINAMLTALKHGLKPVASTMCGIYNSDIAKMYRKLGVKRMILPRDLSLDEISGICKKIPDVEFEAFFLRNGCVFSDCYCLTDRNVVQRVLTQDITKITMKVIIGILKTVMILM